MRWRIHFWAGRIGCWAFFLFLLADPILWGSPASVSALAPTGLEYWLMGVVGACVALRWAIWAHTYKTDLYEYVTMRCDPPLTRRVAAPRNPRRHLA